MHAAQLVLQARDRGDREADVEELGTLTRVSVEEVQDGEEGIVVGRGVYRDSCKGYAGVGKLLRRR